MDSRLIGAYRWKFKRRFARPPRSELCPSPPPADLRRNFATFHHCLALPDLRGRDSRERIQPLVLVADSHASVASAVSRCLAEASVVLAPVTSLGLLPRVVPLVAPLVLVSDLDFGEAFALDVLHELRSSHPALRIIAYSGHDTAIVRRMVHQADLDGFVAKHDSLDVLRTMVDAACGELDGEHTWQTGRRPESGEREGRRKPHDLGALIRWGLDSGFKQGAIARVVGVSLQTVAYHAKRRSGVASP